jgi:uncharacterized membrane protein
MSPRESEIIERYLADIREAASNAPAAERDEFIEEIRSHILDRLADSTSVDDVLRAIGDPRQLAAQFTSQAGLRREARSFKPWSLLRGMLRWSVAGTFGLMAFFVAVFGYGCSSVFFSSLLLKPLFPHQVGLFLGPETLTYGFWDGHLVNSQIIGISVAHGPGFALGMIGPTDGPIRELLGPQIYTVGVFGGLLTFFLTTLFSRWAVRRLGRRKWFAAKGSSRSRDFVFGGEGRGGKATTVV